LQDKVKKEKGSNLKKRSNPTFTWEVTREGGGGGDVKGKERKAHEGKKNKYNLPWSTGQKEKNLTPLRVSSI